MSDLASALIVFGVGPNFGICLDWVGPKLWDLLKIVPKMVLKFWLVVFVEKRVFFTRVHMYNFYRRKVWSGSKPTENARYGSLPKLVHVSSRKSKLFRIKYSCRVNFEMFCSISKHWQYFLVSFQTWRHDRTVPGFQNFNHSGSA